MTRTERFSVTAALLCAAGAMIVLAATRGLWFDEFWTIFLSRHAAPVRELLDTRWGPDVHPPFYTIYTWALEPLTGDGKLAMRLTNLLGLAPIAAGCLIVRRRHGHARFLALFVLLLASSPFFVTYFGEYRSYFLECCGSAFVVLLLHALHFLDRDIDAREDKGLVAAALIGVPLAVMLHFTSGAELLIVCGIAFLYHCWRRHRRTAILLFAAMAIGIALLAGSIALVMHYHPQSPPNQTSAAKGLALAIGMAGAGAGANLAAAGIGAWALFRSQREASRPARDYPWLLVLTLAALVLVIAGLNAVKPFLAMRYMIAFIPVGAALAAWLASRVRWAWAIPLVAANAVLLIAAITVQQARNHRWELYPPRIAGIVARCPATRVIALYTPPLRPEAGAMQAGIRNDRAVFMGGYRLLARQYGFAIEEAPQPDGRGFSVAGPCPTLLWVEQNVYAPEAPAGQIFAVAGLRVPPQATVSEQRDRYSELFTITPPDR